MEYEWSEDGPKPKGEAQAFGECIEKLAATKDGPIKPADIVNEARSNAKLHAMFTWDDAKAGDLYRQVQARTYVSLLRVVGARSAAGAPGPSRAYFFAKPKGSRGGYVSSASVASSSDLSKQLIERVAGQVRSLVERYRDCSAVRPYVARLDDVLDEMHVELQRLTLEINRPERARPREEPRRGETVSSIEELMSMGE